MTFSPSHHQWPPVGDQESGDVEVILISDESKRSQFVEQALLKLGVSFRKEIEQANPWDIDTMPRLITIKAGCPRETLIGGYSILSSLGYEAL